MPTDGPAPSPAPQTAGQPAAPVPGADKDTGHRTLLVVGLVVAAGALFTRPSTAAAATRSAFSSRLGSLRRSGESHSLSTGPAGTWTYTHRHVLRIGRWC